MTSVPEMQAYAQEQGDGWYNLPANGEGWDKPSSVDGELLAAAMRLKRYTDAPLVDPEPWCDEYIAKQYDADVAMLADFAVQQMLNRPAGLNRGE